MNLLQFYENIYRPQNHLASPRTTLQAYRYEIKSFQNFFDSRCRERGETPRPVTLADLSDELLSSAMGWKLGPENECEIPTANKLLRTIGALWRFAKRRKLLETVPDLDKLPEMKREPEAWSLEELERLVQAATRRQGRAKRRGYVGDVPAGLWWPAQILMAASTGVRISAVMEIRTADLDLQRGTVLVRAESQKQKSDQRFELKPEVCEVIRAIKPERHERLFADWPYDQQVNNDSWPALEHAFGQILQSAGLPTSRDCKFHKLRKTFVTMIAAEAGEVVAQAMAGHSHISVTRRYIDKSKLRGPSARDLLPSIPLPTALRAKLAAAANANTPPENAA